jgi:hypothetical protein
VQASEHIDQQISACADWRGALLARLRRLIHEADPEIAEEWKWETAVFAHKGNVCALAPFKDHVKLNFFYGATLPDPDGLFNAGLEAKASRAIDFAPDDAVNEPALRVLIQAAVARNASKKKETFAVPRRPPRKGRDDASGSS